MMSSPNIDDLLKGVGTVAGLGAFLYWTLQKALEKSLDDRFATRLEKTKHQLQVELEQMSVVFQHQKDSFRKVLKAMHAAIKDIEDNYQGSGDWLPISSKEVEKLRRVLSEEGLFLDTESDHALDLFEKIMWSAVNDPALDMFADGGDAQHAQAQMRVIADRVAQHFRRRVGLERAGTDPLQDVELLGACRLITTFKFNGFTLSKESPLRLDDQQNIAQVIAVAKNNPRLLKSELQRLKDAINTSKRDSHFFFDTVADIDHYLTLVGQVTQSQ